MFSCRMLHIVKRVSAVLLCLLLLTAVAAPLSAGASNAPKTVCVGWYESAFNSTSSTGQRSGYAYEYQMKIAAYAGWNYTYVEGSWAELMQMLMDGKIDMMSDISYTEERAEKILYPELPMGTEEYCIFVNSDNHEITAEDYTTLNGKRIGVNKGSYQLGCYKTWAQKHQIEAELVELTGDEYETINRLKSGSLDAYVTPNAFIAPEDHLTSVAKVGSSDFYFAVNKERPDLLSDLNTAMSRIQDENPYYNQMMFEKYIKRVSSNAFLTEKEEDWLASHGAIRVGYQDNYLAFCAKDPDTGELTGALKDFLHTAQDCLTDAHLDFETVAYPTAEEAYEALRQGEIDCVFPSNLSSYDAEQQKLLITPSLVSADIYAVVRQSEPTALSDNNHVIVAVNEGNPNYDAFLERHFPDWRAVYYADTTECLKAVSQSVADCVLVSSYRYNNLSRQCKKYRLTFYGTGISADYYFAVNDGDTELYSILSKSVELVPASSVSAALSYYLTQDARMSFFDFVSENLTVVMVVTTVIVLVILFLFMRSRRSEKMAKQLISATETDRLTGLYNRDYFFQYADRMYRDAPGAPRDAIVLNIEQFHSINALNGRAFGDQVLRILGSEIRTIAEEFNGIGGRFGADRFDIYCRHIEDYQTVFERLQRKLDVLASNVSVRLRMGVMPWQEGLEPIQLFDRARTACNMARGHYMEHLIVFDEKVRDRELLDQRLLNDLRNALDNFEFEVYYHPKFDIRSDTPRLMGAEALIRWQHPKLGMITPDKFIPLFERNGQIAEVDRYVWARAAKQIACWRTQYGVTLPVSVNLSRVDVFHSELDTVLDNILTQEGLSHSALELEITETAYTENADQLIHVVKHLHRMGFTIEMDDFGTGYSSLNMLSSMPIDVLKMDRGFIRNIENNPKDTQMVSLILGIAKNLGIPVIAEGVETAEQIHLLKKLGCAYVQGYYFSRPLHPADFEAEYLKNQ